MEITIFDKQSYRNLNQTTSMSVKKIYRLLFPLEIKTPVLFNRQIGMPIRTIVLSFTKTFVATRVDPKAKAGAQSEEAPTKNGVLTISIPGISSELIVLDTTRVGYETITTMTLPYHAKSLMLRTLEVGDEANLEAGIELIQGKIKKGLLPISEKVRDGGDGWEREGETGLFVLEKGAKISPLDAKFIPSEWH